VTGESVSIRHCSRVQVPIRRSSGGNVTIRQVERVTRPRLVRNRNGEYTSIRHACTGFPGEKNSCGEPSHPPVRSHEAASSTMPSRAPASGSCHWMNTWHVSGWWSHSSPLRPCRTKFFSTHGEWAGHVPSTHAIAVAAVYSLARLTLGSTVWKSKQ
jgi:hypothetical protein